jgi:hypothetical protein
MGDATPIYGDDAEMKEARCARHGLRIELQRSGARSRLIAILLACAAMLQPNALFAETIPVRHTEGLIHAFLVVRALECKAIADGQMTFRPPPTVPLNYAGQPMQAGDFGYGGRP